MTNQLLAELEMANKKIEKQKKIINVMIDNEEEYCIENNNLKERIDKAIEYIEYKKGLFTKDVVQTKVIEDLLEILKEEDK